jgi:hypothetical protein
MQDSNVIIDLAMRLYIVGIIATFVWLISAERWQEWGDYFVTVLISLIWPVFLIEKLEIPVFEAMQQRIWLLVAAVSTTVTWILIWLLDLLPPVAVLLGIPLWFLVNLLFARAFAGWVGRLVEKISHRP